MGLDKGFAGWDFFTHQGMEYIVSFGGIIDIYREQGAGIWIHGGFPQLLSAHLAQALIALNTHVFGSFELTQRLLFFLFGIKPLLLFCGFDAVKRGLGNKQVPVVD